jgi:LCP family protein required for cell wall assembly
MKIHSKRPQRTTARSTSSGVMLLAILLTLLVPGLGHALQRRRRAAWIFAAPPLFVAAIAMLRVALGGSAALISIAVSPSGPLLIALLNIALALWRLVALLNLMGGVPRPLTQRVVAVLGALVLIAAPHLAIARADAALDTILSGTFASGGAASASPRATYAQSATPGWADTTPSPSTTPDPSETALSGREALPPLGVATPWSKAGATPWGSDGAFTLLLLGSDGGADRWNRRMDVMLLIKVDVASGAIGMVGIPRNLRNAPFPLGSAEWNASTDPCRCLAGMLNSTYTEATITHPERWPGSGVVAGIGAVRSMVATLTGQAIDAVLVADLVGVIKVVDAMGGVEMDVPQRVIDANYPDPGHGDIYLDISVGHHHFDGRVALAYARSRHQDSDYGRMYRQQLLLKAIRAQIGPTTILQAPDLANAAAGFVWTDISREALPSLVELFGRAQSENVCQLLVRAGNFTDALTPKSIVRIQGEIAHLLDPGRCAVLPAPTPSPKPTASLLASPSASPPPTAPTSP